MKNPLRYIYLKIRDEIMARGGLQPRNPYVYSLGKKTFCNDEKLRILLPNLAKGYHHILRQYWELYGLGRTSLLVSESRPVKSEMSRLYPKTTFTTTDLFSELMTRVASEGPDYIWDVCMSPPLELRKIRFGSVICHALLEHVIDPIAALRNIAELVFEGGYIYILTHTPSFHKHSYPRDYIRFHHDYFEDLPAFFSGAYNIGIELIEMYSDKGVVCVCYRKTSITVNLCYPWSAAKL